MSREARTPPASAPEYRRRFQEAKRRDTGPEMAIRRLVHREGLRYFVDRKVLPGMRRRADLVFPGARVVVFIDGCFWHGCPDHGTLPKAHREWWRDKIERNRRRDRDTDQRLEEAGWTVIRAWEHDDPAAVAARVR